MSRWLTAGVVGLFSVAALAGDDPDQSAKLKKLMQRKLQHAQKVLEGVTLKDFDKIAEHAEELAAVSKEAGFRVVRTPKYELYSNEFRRQAESLAQQAKEKNLDGAALSYVELTLNCVKCHKYVRETRMTRSGPT
jgi:hypothetical protein